MSTSLGVRTSPELGRIAHPETGESRTGTGVRAHVASLLLALSISTGTGVQVASAANTGNSAPSTSAPATADKGGLQMLLLSDGTSITFADFGKKGPEEQEKMMGMVKDETMLSALDEYIAGSVQVANQRKESELTELQVANQTLRAEQQKFIADAMLYMQKVEDKKVSIDLAIIQSILDTEIETPGVIPPILLKWAQSHNTTTVASIAGR